MAVLGVKELALHARLKAVGKPKSGRIGAFAYYMKKGRLCWHRYVVPQDPRTARQAHSRAAFAAASKTWSEGSRLTEAHLDEWCADGAKRQSRPRLGQSGPLTGQQNYIGRNCTRNQRDCEMLLHPRQREQEKVKNKALRPELRFFAVFSTRLLIAYAGQLGGPLGLAGANVKIKGTGPRFGPRPLPASHTSVNPSNLAWLRESPTFCPAPLTTCHQPVLRIRW
jgi:hypothetical protein